MTFRILLSWIGLAVAGAALVLASAPRPGLAQPGDEAPQVADMDALEGFIDGYVAARLEDDDPAGTTVAVVAGDQLFAKGYGLADADTGRAVDADTLFRIGSISKLFVWLSAHMLAEEGKLDLDADVNTYLDGFSVPEAFGKPITMRDLMAHRPGFEDNIRDFVDADRDIPLREAVARQFPARVAPPGERTSYSNFGTNLAAYVVERASGTDYYDFVRSRILEPAGMYATTLHDPGTGKNPNSLDARMAKPHGVKDGAAVAEGYMPVRPQEPVGAVAMSARDAAKFMRLLLDGTQLADGSRLLSEEGWARLATNAFPNAKGGDDMGWGFMLNDVDGAATLGHGGGTKFLSWLFVIPERNVGVFVSSNGNTAEARGERLAWEIARRLEGTDAAAAFRTLAGDAKAAEETAGTYLGNRRQFTGLLAVTGLGGETEVEADDGFLVVGDTRYAPLGNDIWVSRAGLRLRAERGDDGKVVRLHGSLGSATMERVGFWDSSRPVLVFAGLAIALSLTTLLGMWWRWKRPSNTTPRGRRLMWVALVSALLWIALAAAMGWATLSLADVDLAELDKAGFPPFGLRVAQVLLVALALQALLHLVGAAMAWKGSGWSWWRRIHFTLFGVMTALAMLSLWRWDVVGTSLYG